MLLVLVGHRFVRANRALHLAAVRIAVHKRWTAWTLVIPSLILAVRNSGIHRVIQCNFTVAIHPSSCTL